jgi:hypothetical protein
MLDVHGRSTPHSMSKLNDNKANNATGTSVTGPAIRHPVAALRADEKRNEAMTKMNDLQKN